MVINLFFFLFGIRFNQSFHWRFEYSPDVESAKLSSFGNLFLEMISDRAYEMYRQGGVVGKNISLKKSLETPNEQCMDGRFFSILVEERGKSG